MPEADLKILGDQADLTQRTYLFRDEDHTLGNSLRHVLMNNKDTEFCGYSVPHPSESLVNIRLQTTGKPADEVMEEGLTDLANICDSIKTQLMAKDATPEWPRAT
uniref:DNA-directed RNA polymerase RBP11-like dimerisation domain-containing protein n=1 Tax=Aureoumbra lagunensis TaxID=44058 RepID=A0A7S3JWW1_9STRA